MSTLIEKLSWRYATKKFDPARTVPTEKIDRIIEAVRLTATSSGLQPFELLLVTNPEIREKIRAVAWNQAQVTGVRICWFSPPGTTSPPSAST
jgi:nitroreductase